MRNKQFCTKAAAMLLVGALTSTNIPVMVYAETAPAVVETNQTADQTGDQTTSGQYVLMNVPYAAFYQNDLTGNDKAVDGVSSATLNKTRNRGIVAGSYHVDPKGSEISGITIPVKLGEGVTFADLSGYTEITDASSVSITMPSRTGETTTEYKGKDALFEAADYAYYKLSETPAVYKEVTKKDGKLQFSEIKGQAPQVLTDVTAALSTTSRYGDYQLNVKGLALKGTIYGAVVSTKEGVSYGLRHLENIWAKGAQLAWASGFKTSVKNCPLNAEHYQSMMGKTINKVTYYTSDGIFEVNTGDIYVPVKFGDTPLKVEDAEQTKGNTSISIEKLPEDYAPEYAVENLEGAKIENGVLNFGDAKPGIYTVNVTDKNKKYVSLSTNFTIYTESTPVQYQADTTKLVPAQGYDEAAWKDYIANIASVYVNGEEYWAEGRGAVTIINADGTLKTDAEPLNADAQGYNIVVKADGYKNDLTFTYNKNAVDAKEAEQLLADVKGSYSNLFKNGILDAKYDKDWHDAAAAAVGESKADEMVSMLKKSIGSDTYGAEAQSDAFCCNFIGGVKTLTFDGTQIQADMEDGSKIAHNYHFLRKDKYGQADVYLFESDDKKANDILQYVMLCTDTPDSTYHIELRYGNNLEDLLKMTTGAYANWLVGAIPTSAFTEENQETIQNVIALFCIENLESMATDETKKQWSSLEGIWDADLSAYADVPEYKNAKMYCELKKDGTGVTYADMQGTGKFEKVHEFNFYVYDNDGNAKTNSGVYFVSGDKVEKSNYEVKKVGENTVLSFQALDGGNISYIKREPTTISLKKASASIYVKGTTKISATVKHGKGKIEYKSNKISVAVVSKDGKVTAKKKGTAKITVKNNGVEKVFTVKVKNPVLNKTKVTLKVGKKTTLKVTGKVGKVKYNSTNTKIVKVTKTGKITAVKKGSAVVKVATNGLVLKCKVTVK